MSKLRQAAEQSLEALELYLTMDTVEESHLLEVDIAPKAITALRAALEEPEHKPVAWRTFDGEGGYDYRSYEMNETYDKEWAERNPNHKGWVEPLYTAPPKKQWVSLTDQEVWEAIDDVLEGGGWLDVARALEQAFKEKNT